MALPDAAEAYYRSQQRVSLSTLVLAQQLWRRLGRGDFDIAWRSVGPQLLTVLSAGQLAAVQQASAYVPVVLDELGIDPRGNGQVAQASLVGVASDGRDLASLLYQPVVRARAALGQGADLGAALAEGGALMDDIVSQQVVDAGRAAESVASVVRPAVTGYVRQLQLPSCQRCVILAGRFYRFSAGFDRHPRCDCRHIPVNDGVAQDLTTDPLGAIRAGQVTGLSKADRRAIIEGGADPFKVINATRGMSTEQVFGQQLKVTTEGTSRRAGNRSVTARINGRTVKVRPRPEALYKLAGDDRAEAQRLLRLYGYVL